MQTIHNVHMDGEKKCVNIEERNFPRAVYVCLCDLLKYQLHTQLNWHQQQTIHECWNLKTNNYKRR